MDDDIWASCPPLRNRNRAVYREIEYGDSTGLRRYEGAENTFWFTDRNGRDVTEHAAKMYLRSHYNDTPRYCPSASVTKPGRRSHESIAMGGSSFPTARRERSGDNMSLNLGSPGAPALPQVREAANRHDTIWESEIPGTSARSGIDTESMRVPRRKRAHTARSTRSGSSTIQEVTSNTPAADFRRRDKHFYEPGRVFQILWHEPAVDPSNRDSGYGPGSDTSNQKVFSKKRPMVVVAQFWGHCLCVLIYTYGDQGLLKTGIPDTDIKHYQVMHDAESQPFLKPGEEDRGLKKESAIAVNLTSRTEWNPMSRVCFNRISTVEYNFQVYDVGIVADVNMFLKNSIILPGMERIAKRAKPGRVERERLLDPRLSQSSVKQPKVQEVDVEKQTLQRQPRAHEFEAEGSSSVQTPRPLHSEAAVAAPFIPPFYGQSSNVGAYPVPFRGGAPKRGNKGKEAENYPSRHYRGH